MSSDSLAIFRKHKGDELRKLAEDHFEHDLQQSDRDTIRTAASKFSTHTAVGSLVGLGLGALLAFRVRSGRVKMFNAFKAKEKPTHVQFADGRTEAIPDIAPLLKPTLFGDVAAYFFFTMGGLFLGGETGLLTGSISAGRTISQDPACRTRIMIAYNRFRADALRAEADALDKAGMSGTA